MAAQAGIPARGPVTKEAIRLAVFNALLLDVTQKDHGMTAWQLSTATGYTPDQVRRMFALDQSGQFTADVDQRSQVTFYRLSRMSLCVLVTVWAMPELDKARAEGAPVMAAAGPCFVRALFVHPALPHGWTETVVASGLGETEARAMVAAKMGRAVRLRAFRWNDGAAGYTLLVERDRRKAGPR